MPRHILLRTIFLVELAIIAYILGPLAKTIILAIIVYALLKEARHVEAKSLTIYLAIIVAGYTLSAHLSHVTIQTWLNGLLNILSIGLALGLIVVTITPRDIDALATILHLPRTLHLVLRTSLVNIRQLLIEVWEAHTAVKAKHRGKLVGLNALRYTGKLLVTTIIIALTRSNQVAEALLLNPPPRNPVYEKYGFWEITYTATTTILLIIIIVLRTTGLSLPHIFQL